ncbi:MAG: peptidoglycan-binding protein [Rhizobiaceae bacterium]|nr:peptidoglycan-binding protein [Rhizobiaceae bacterium]
MSPKRKPSKKKIEKPSFVSSLMSTAGETIVRHPSIVGGTTAFVIIFSFIASNALFYQKGAHPAPILNMRGPQFIVSGSTRPNDDVRVIRTDDGVKTFKVQRSDQLQTSSIPVPAQPIQQAPVRVQTVKPVAETANVESTIQGDDLVRNIQTELAKQKLYLDVVDGLTGPNTSKAVQGFQERAGLPVDGKITEELLARLIKANTPKVMARIETNTEQASKDMVRRIQIGLSQSAYPNIEVDGLAGKQTREAIAQFEKHYRLPITGLPNQQVLDKLKSIGAF